MTLHWRYYLLLLLVSIPIFLFLDAIPIRLWDESRLAINACEMYNSGNYLVTTFNGKPDMWNTKPPLMIWFQVFSMKLFGINEWAVRLPSAIAALLTCCLLMLFIVRYLNNFWFGFICVIVLITSSGYVEIHAIRTGDYEALLTLFITSALLSFFSFIEKSKPKYLYLFFISMSLAALTKSAAALMIIPGVIIYTCFKKKLLILLKTKHLYCGLMLFILGTGWFYIFREISFPGYLRSVFYNEFGGRLFFTIDEHHHSFWFYFVNLFDSRYIIWVFFLPVGIFFNN